MKDQLDIIESIEKQFKRFKRNPFGLLLVIIAVYILTYLKDSSLFPGMLHLIPTIVTLWLLFFVYVQFVCKKVEKLLREERKQLHERIKKYKIHCNNYTLSLDECEAQDGSIVIVVTAAMAAGESEEIKNIAGTLNFFIEKDSRKISVGHYRVEIDSLKSDCDYQVEIKTDCPNLAYWKYASFAQEDGHEYYGGHMVYTFFSILNAKLLFKSNFSRSIIVLKDTLSEVALRIKYNLSPHIIYYCSGPRKYSKQQKEKLLKDFIRRLGYCSVYLLFLLILVFALYCVLRYDIKGIRSFLDAIAAQRQ